MPLGDLYDLYDDVQESMDQLAQQRAEVNHERERAPGADHTGWEG